jgi:hypothetical protein
VLDVNRGQTTKGLLDVVNDQHRVLFAATWDCVANVQIGRLV